MTRAGLVGSDIDVGALWGCLLVRTSDLSGKRQSRLDGTKPRFENLEVNALLFLPGAWSRAFFIMYSP